MAQEDIKDFGFEVLSAHDWAILSIKDAVPKSIWYRISPDKTNFSVTGESGPPSTCEPKTISGRDAFGTPQADSDDSLNAASISITLGAIAGFVTAAGA